MTKSDLEKFKYANWKHKKNRKNEIASDNADETGANQISHEIFKEWFGCSGGHCGGSHGSDFSGDCDCGCDDGGD